MQCRIVRKRIKDLKANIKKMKNDKTRLWSSETIQKKEYCLNMLKSYLKYRQERGEL